MNVHWLASGQLTLEFIPKYVVPGIVILGVLIFYGCLLWQHFAIVRARKAQVYQKEVAPELPVIGEPNPAETVEAEIVSIELVRDKAESVEAVPEESIIDCDWTSLSFFERHAHDSSRLRINTVVIHALVDEDIMRLAENERWFVEWYWAERKKGITHWSTLGPVSLHGRSQDDICRELRALHTALALLEDEGIH